jgi:F1F0 ATPase subunit 2
VSEAGLASGVLVLGGPFLVGLLIGGAYFAGLWLTVRELRRVARPALVLLGSTIARAGLVLAAFALVADGGWERLAAYLLGFVVARTVLTGWAARARGQGAGR